MASIKVQVGANVFQADVEKLADVQPFFNAWIATQEGTTGLSDNLTKKAKMITDTTAAIADVAGAMENTAKET